MGETNMKKVVAVFLKYPEPGKVKTRLAEGIGEDDATRIYCRLVGLVFERISRFSGADSLVICFDPVERRESIEEWLRPWSSAFPGEVIFHPQCSGDLGDRLEGASEFVFSRSQDSLLAIVGTDCVDLDSEVFEQTWTALQQSRAAVGPCHDGGYYLIGLPHHTPEVFREIPWSSEHTFSATVEAAAKAGLQSVELPSRSDVDHEEDLEQIRPQLAPRPCVFFDRDGVVNRSPGPGYVLRWEDFQLQEGIIEAIQAVRAQGWLAVLITSQKGVGKGLMSQEELDRIHHNLQKTLLESGALLDGIYAYTGSHCSYQPKPDPQMIHQAAEDFGIDLSRSWMVGDADRDIEMGLQAELPMTVRIRGEKDIGIAATQTLDSILNFSDLFKK